MEDGVCTVRSLEGGGWAYISIALWAIRLEGLLYWEFGDCVSMYAFYYPAMCLFCSVYFMKARY